MHVSGSSYNGRLIIVYILQNTVNDAFFVLLYTDVACLFEKDVSITPLVYTAGMHVKN